MATANSVANEFIRLAGEEGRSLTPLQLMKLTYIAHGWMLGLYQRSLFSDRIEAWKYGPVIPDLYHSMKRYGGSPVTSPLSTSCSGDLDETERDLVEQVYRLYGRLTGVQLSALTHQLGTPWATSYTPDVWNLPIGNDLIAEHYRQLASERSHVSN